MLAKRLISKGVKEFLWAGLLLSTALVLAISSSFARQNGLYFASVILSLLALLVAAVATITLVPSLFRRVRRDYWSAFRFLRITKRGAFFLFLLVLIALSTFNTGNNLLVLVLSFLLAALLVSGMTSNIVLYKLRVRLSLPEAIHAGQRAVLIVRLQNQKRVFPSFVLRLKGRRGQGVDEESTSFFSQEVAFPYIKAGNEATTRMECEFKNRGLYPVTGFEVRTQFPFGFFVRGREVAADGKITVYPATIELNGLLLKFPVLQGSDLYAQKGTGTGLYNIRDYQRGDDLRFVHWRSTAKLSRLMVKEFMRETDDFLQIVLSTQLSSPDGSSLMQFERALSYITSLAVLYRKRGEQFSFYSGEFEVHVDGRKEKFESLMDYLAVVQPSEEPLLEARRIKDGAVVFMAGEHPLAKGHTAIDFMKL